MFPSAGAKCLSGFLDNNENPGAESNLGFGLGLIISLRTNWLMFVGTTAGFPTRTAKLKHLQFLLFITQYQKHIVVQIFMVVEKWMTAFINGLTIIVLFKDYWMFVCLFSLFQVKTLIDLCASNKGVCLTGAFQNNRLLCTNSFGDWFN